MLLCILLPGTHAQVTRMQSAWMCPWNRRGLHMEPKSSRLWSIASSLASSCVLHQIHQWWRHTRVNVLLAEPAVSSADSEKTRRKRHVRVMGRIHEANINLTERLCVPCSWNADLSLQNQHNPTVCVCIVSLLKLIKSAHILSKHTHTHRYTHSHRRVGDASVCFGSVYPECTGTWVWF